MNASALQQYLDFAYIAAAVLFILSLKFLSSPKSARWGVLAGEIGAALAVVVTLFNPEVVQYKWVLIPLIIGAGVGVPTGLGAYDGGAAADRLEPCFRRAVGGDDRHC